MKVPKIGLDVDIKGPKIGGGIDINIYKVYYREIKI